MHCAKLIAKLIGAAGLWTAALLAAPDIVFAPLALLCTGLFAGLLSCLVVAGGSWRMGLLALAVPLPLLVVSPLLGSQDRNVFAALLLVATLGFYAGVAVCVIVLARSRAL